MKTILINEHGHRYDEYTHLFLTEKDEIITHISDAQEVFEALKEQEKNAIFNLVSRAYENGFENGRKLMQKKIVKFFDLDV